ncbi:MAG TPA: hypothetical protein VGK19_20290 [Capsulimonadaceae bacterium]|jgi:hypothetical protein
MTDMRTSRELPVEGVVEHSAGQENDGTTNVSGTGQRYGEPDVARTASFDQDNPHIILAKLTPHRDDTVVDPASTGHAPGQKSGEVYGGQRP